MPLPPGPMRLQCTQCGRTHWNPGYSDAIAIRACSCCGSFQVRRISPARIPRALWPAVRALTKGLQ